VPGDHTYSEAFSKLLAYLQGLYHTYQFLHWQVSGDNYYADHLLFQRLYESVEKEIDPLAEKAIGLTNDPSTISPIQHSNLVSKYLAQFADGAEDGINSSLRAERGLINLISQTREALEQQGKLTDGLDNMLQGVADTHEGHLYLLQQRLSNPQGVQAMLTKAANVKAAVDPQVKAIVDALKANPNTSMMSLRPHLEKIFKPRDISFVTSPIPAFMIKTKGKTLVVVNKKYADDPEAVVGPLAIGYLGAQARVQAMLTKAANDPPRIVKLRKIVQDKQYAKVENLTVDLYTASVLVQVYDALSGVNKMKFAQMPMRQMVDVGYKLVQSNVASKRSDRFDAKAKQETIATLLKAGRQDLVKEVMALKAVLPDEVQQAINNLQKAKKLRYPDATVQNLFKEFMDIANRNRIKNPQRLLASVGLTTAGSVPKLSEYGPILGKRGYRGEDYAKRAAHILKKFPNMSAEDHKAAAAAHLRAKSGWNSTIAGMSHAFAYALMKSGGDVWSPDLRKYVKEATGSVVITAAAPRFATKSFGNERITFYWASDKDRLSVQTGGGAFAIPISEAQKLGKWLLSQKA